jgi:protein involved in polysaccharide export with SLBB domain
MPFFMLLTMLVALVFGGFTLPATADAILIGPQDKLRLRVYEWRADTGEARAWEAFDAEFIVADDGRLQLPLVGSVTVTGQSLEQVADDVAGRLKTQAGLLKQPSVVVEVVEFRPFYVVGSVTAPGEFAYRPGMTVLNAVSLAGGMRRSADMMQRFERDAIATRGDLRVLALEIEQLAARRARLHAELQEAETIAFPADLVARRQENDTIATALDEEENIFQSRRQSLQQEVDANQRLQALLAEQIEALEAQVELKTRQLASVEEELAGVRDLVERGLGTAPRQSALERTAAEVESGQRDLMRSIIGAQVDISNAERNIITLLSNRRREVAEELRATQAQIENLSAKFETARHMLQEAEVIAPASLAAANRRESMEPIYSIIRLTSGGMEEIEATELTSLRPGDTVRVLLPMPEIPSTGALTGGGAGPQLPGTEAVPVQ